MKPNVEHRYDLLCEDVSVTVTENNYELDPSDIAIGSNAEVKATFNGLWKDHATMLLSREFGSVTLHLPTPQLLQFLEDLRKSYEGKEWGDTEWDRELHDRVRRIFKIK